MLISHNICAPEVLTKDSDTLLVYLFVIASFHGSHKQSDSTSLQLVVGYQTLTFVGLGRNITLLYA
jgi:hypothetical protein